MAANRLEVISMFVGPFFYLDNSRIGRKGLIADLCPLDKAVLQDERIVSPVSHETLLDRTVPGESVEDHARGQVVYDRRSSLAIIYIDRCIEKNVDEIVRLFELATWVIEYDERYVCPRCDHLTNRF
jgi:hypothetical protein